MGKSKGMIVIGKKKEEEATWEGGRVEKPK
jgi:hypothetical protein